MKRSSFLFFKSLLVTAIGGLSFSLQAAPLTPGKAIPLPGTHGGFDFIRLDPYHHRLLLGHEQNHSLDVFDLGSQTLIKSVPTGTAQDATVDFRTGHYYVSCNDPARMVTVDAKTLTISGSVPLPAPADLITFNPVTGLVRDCNDTVAEEWLIDPGSQKIVGTLKFEGRGLEDLAFGSDDHLLFQAVKGSNTIAVADPVSNKVIHAWPLSPDTSPHGIAVIPESDRLLAACKGKLVLLDRNNGTILARISTPAHVDELAYDPTLGVAYCASRRGKISVIDVKANRLISLGDVDDQPGTGSIVVDPQTHLVWIAFHRGNNAYVQPFTPEMKVR